MRLVSYRSPNDDGDRHIGVVIGDAVAPLADMRTFYGDVAHYLEVARGCDVGSIAVDGLTLAPPVPTDAKVICAAINYVKHGGESKLPTPTFPNLFARWASELVVDGEGVAVPLAEPDGLDWEVELAAIIGATAMDADHDGATASILGYTVANDISARSAQLRAMTLGTGQWALGKNPDKSGAIGSFVETADGVDVRNLRITATVDGEVMQDATTADMVFSVEDLIVFISRQVTLRPGDLILTGTPEGTGFGLEPRRYMRPGSSVTVSVEGICSVTSPILDHSFRK